MRKERGLVNAIPRVSPSPAICKEWRLEPEMLVGHRKRPERAGEGEEQLNLPV